MSVDIYRAIALGVDKVTLTLGDGSGQPQVVSATSEGVNTVRVTFDRGMFNVLPRTGGAFSIEGARAAIYVPTTYTITEDGSGNPLHVVRVKKVTELVYDLMTVDQAAKTYNLAVANDLMDIWGNTLDPANDTAQFVGTPRTYISNDDVRVFIGMYTGMQEESLTDILPDLNAPLISNEDPAPSDQGVLQNKVVSFDITDSGGAGLAPTSILIYVEGALAYDGSTNSFVAPYDGAGSLRTIITDGFTFEVDKTASWDSYGIVSVRVVAEDTAPVPNTVDQSWQFRAEDWEDPTVTANFPTGSGVDQNTLISFSVNDETTGSGIDQLSIDVTVNGQPAVVNGIFQIGWAGASSSITPNASNGFDVVVDSETSFGSFEGQAVAVYAEDNWGNTVSFNWNFTTQDWRGPLVEPLDPVSGELDVEIDANITVRISDEQDVDENTIQVEVDRGPGFVLAFDYSELPGSQFKSGFDGPNSQVSTSLGVTTIVIDPTLDFGFGETIRVRVTALDSVGNPARLT